MKIIIQNGPDSRGDNVLDFEKAKQAKNLMAQIDTLETFLRQLPVVSCVGNIYGSLAVYQKSDEYKSK